MSDGRVSVMSSRRVVEAFKRLRVGSPVTVRLIARAAAGPYQLGWLPGPNIIVRCRHAESRSLDDDAFAGEIALLRGGRAPAIEIVPTGRAAVDRNTDDASTCSIALS